MILAFTTGAGPGAAASTVATIAEGPDFNADTGTTPRIKVPR